MEGDGKKMKRRRVNVIVPTKFTEDDEVIEGFSTSSKYLTIKYKIYRVCKFCGLEADTVGDLDKFVGNKYSRFGHENRCIECAKQQRINRNKPKSQFQVNSLKEERTLEKALAFAARRG